MRALVLVDLQNDFCPGGALGVARGDEVVAVANRLAPRFPLVVATQDAHPPDHGSFAANTPGRRPYELGELAGLPQVMWPVHCVAGSAGAAFHPALDVARVHQVFPKGTDPAIDSYSGFFDNGKRKSTGLGEALRARGVDEIAVLGLATDYCVKATCLDGAALGFKVVLVEDGCRGVELAPGDTARAIEELRAAGVRIARSEELG
jgi:nicotinamidase/pyrazinamidase